MARLEKQLLPSSFRALLRAELAKRCARNPRYSLRAFARSLGIDHATLSQLLRGKRQITRAAILRLGRRLGLDEQALSTLATTDGASRDRAHADVGAFAGRVAEDPLHHLLLALVSGGGLPPDARRAARALGSTVDEINVAIQRLTALGLLALEGDAWRDVDGLGTAPTDAFVRAVWRRAAATLQRLDAKPPLEVVPAQASAPYPVAAFQIISRDPERAARFYSAVFGWSVDAANALGFRRLETGGLPGGIWPAPPEAQPFIQLFIATDDVAATMARARAAGARVILPPQHLPEGDEMAILSDLEGIPFALARLRAGRSAEQASKGDAA